MGKRINSIHNGVFVFSPTENFEPKVDNAMYLNANHVAINTSNPQVKLDINGGLLVKNSYSSPYFAKKKDKSRGGVVTLMTRGGKTGFCGLSSENTDVWVPLTHSAEEFAVCDLRTSVAVPN